MAAIAHSWVSILLALLALVLLAGRVLASYWSSSSWEIMYGHCLFLFGDTTKMSLTAGVVLVSSLAVGDSLLLFCLCILLLTCVFVTLVCVAELIMGLLVFFASFSLKFVATV